MITVVEIKTLNGFYYDYILKGKSEPYWLKQLSYYADAVSSLFNEDVQAVSMLFDRNLGRITMMPLEYEDWRDGLDDLVEMHNNDILPGCKEDDCDKCELKKVCKNFDGDLSEFIGAALAAGVVELIENNEEE